MAAAADVLRGVTFNEIYGHVPEEARLDEALGFITLGGLTSRSFAPYVALIGFGVPGWQLGTDDVPGSADSITDLYKIPEGLRTVDRQGKGVGVRLYNTPQALGGTAENPERIGAYTFAIDPNRIHDARRPHDRTFLGQVRRGAQHVSKIRLERRKGIDAVVRRVHAEQGWVDVALYNQTPDAERQRARRGQPESVIPEEFMIIRDSAIGLRKAGEYHRSSA